MSINIEKMYPLGDAAIVVQLGREIDWETHRKVRELSSYLSEHPISGIIEHVPSYTSVTVYYDMRTIATHAQDLSSESPYDIVFSTLSRVINDIKRTDAIEPEVVEIPVCYGGDHGPDLDDVAQHNGLTPEKVIEIHSQQEYLTYMLGFAPGFPYLGGLREQIATPRRATPRLKIPEGTVGIAGMQTGVYPLESPGGWQLIGRTPLRLFRPDQMPPTLIQMGNLVRFKPISPSEFEHLREVRG